MDIFNTTILVNKSGRINDNPNIVSIIVDGHIDYLNVLNCPRLLNIVINEDCSINKLNVIHCINLQNIYGYALVCSITSCNKLINFPYNETLNVRNSSIKFINHLDITKNLYLFDLGHLEKLKGPTNNLENLSSLDCPNLILTKSNVQNIKVIYMFDGDIKDIPYMPKLRVFKGSEITEKYHLVPLVADLYKVDSRNAKRLKKDTVKKLYDYL